MIDGDAPKDWHDLQDRAARILRECGLEAETECDLALARGDVKVDVLARDPDATPPTLHVCECKHWQTAVPKNIVHAFRTVVADSGAHFGYVISSSGFQSGAYEAVSHSNVKLVSWLEFQELFAERWFHRYMAPTLIEEGDALHEYTEPFNSRIIKKAEQLGAESGLRFRELVEQHADPSLALLMLWFRPLSKRLTVPQLPLRNFLGVHADKLQLRAEILDAIALRPLMEQVIQFYRQSTAEFDGIFGGRA